MYGIPPSSALFRLFAGLTQHQLCLQWMWDADTVLDTAGDTVRGHWADAASVCLHWAMM